MICHHDWTGNFAPGKKKEKIRAFNHVSLNTFEFYVIHKNQQEMTLRLVVEFQAVGVVCGIVRDVQDTSNIVPVTGHTGCSDYKKQEQT